MHPRFADIFASPPRRSLVKWVVACLAVAWSIAPPALAEPGAGESDELLERSNAHAARIVDLWVRFMPEIASQLGMAEADERIADFRPDGVARRLEAMGSVERELRAALDAEDHPRVREDLEILIRRLEHDAEGLELWHRTMLPYDALGELIFGGMRGLLDDQVPPERRARALDRLRRYAGLLGEDPPIAELAADRIRERLDVPGLLGPVRAELERDLAQQATYLDGIAPLFERFEIEGAEPVLERLREQLAGYDAFLRAELLPRARDDFRLPPELYAYQLRDFGIDWPVDELERRAQVAYQGIRTQMEGMGRLVAHERGWEPTGYVEIMRRLKQEQLVGDAIVEHYRERNDQLERIVREHGIVTLPRRDLRIELASPAETAAQPAPHVRMPNLVDNQGEELTFVLPLSIPGEKGEEGLRMDDFTHAAASWTLSAHEARPGHEHQFSIILERDVPLARALFAFNSVNVEGWALYAEAEVQPYQPVDGQLFTLQLRLLRAARAFLDPGLQLGSITREQAEHVLREEVGLSDAMVLQEIERYTFRAPGQAPSYFVGYSELLRTRAQAERALGDVFDRRAFNDFVLEQGLLPPALLRAAVMERFVPEHRRGGDSG